MSSILISQDQFNNALTAQGIATDHLWQRLLVDGIPAFMPPAIGAPWPGQGGIYAGLVAGEDGAPDYHLILSTEKPSARLNWKNSLAWAASLNVDGHADFQLPDRREAAVLFGNLKSQFDPAWHWLRTQYSEGYAWSQYFDSGTQYGDAKSYEGRARAVRRFIA